MTEDGSEAYNVIDGNLAAVIPGIAIDTAGEGRPNNIPVNRDFGWDGTAFWFHGINNYIRNNIAVNAREYGYIFSLKTLERDNIPLPKSPGVDQDQDPIDPDQIQLTTGVLMPIAQFSNNEVYSSQGGLTVWNLGVICCDEDVFKTAPQAVFSNTRLWHISRNAFYNYGAHRLFFDGLTAYDDPGTLWDLYHNDNATMFFFRDYEVRDFRVRNATVHNFKMGMLMPPKVGSILDPYGNVPGTVSVESSNFRNITNFSWRTIWAVTPNNAPRDVTLTNVTTGPTVRGAGTDINMDYSVDCWDGPTLNPPQPSLLEWPDCTPHGSPTGEANKQLPTADRVFIYNWQNVTGDNFRTYYTQQAPDMQMRASDPAINLTGCPARGLTNAQCLATYGVTLAGEIAPCTNTRPGIEGYACTP
jgi:hypothetical protein